MSNVEFPLKKLEILGLAMAPLAMDCSTSVESILQIEPFYAKQSQYAGLWPEIQSTKFEIRINGIRQNEKTKPICRLLAGNPKYETRNSKQIQMLNVLIFKTNPIIKWII